MDMEIVIVLVGKPPPRPLKGDGRFSLFSADGTLKLIFVFSLEVFGFLIVLVCKLLIINGFDLFQE